MSIGFREIVTLNYYGRPGSANQIQFQPAIRSKAWGAGNILRISMPYNTGGVAGTPHWTVCFNFILLVPAK